MKKYKELEKLKETLEEVLCSDELETTLFYLDEYKRLKIKEEVEEEEKLIEEFMVFIKS